MNLKDLRLEFRSNHPIHFGDFAENRERLLADLFPANCERPPTGRGVIRLVQNASRRCRKHTARARAPEHSTGLNIATPRLAIFSQANWNVDPDALSVRRILQDAPKRPFYIKA
jgi:hypothetical protein